MKRHLHPYVMSIDTIMKNQVWLRFSVLPNVLLGSIYVLPSDSHYFNPNNFSFIQEKVKWSEGESDGGTVDG